MEQFAVFFERLMVVRDIRSAMGSKKKDKSSRMGTDGAGPSEIRDAGVASKGWLRIKPRLGFLIFILCSIIILDFSLLLRETTSMAQLRARFKFDVPGFSMLRSMDRQVAGGGWVRFPVARDETKLYIHRLRENLTSSNPCIRVRTHRAYVLGFPDVGTGNVVRLSTGTIHTLSIVSFDIHGERRCAGGDYFETDLSGPYWKSRPPVIDLGSGSYELKLQVDSRFSGRYKFTVILLFANYHGRHLLPAGSKNMWVRDETVANFEIEFVDLKPADTPATAKPQAELRTCRGRDFKLKQWSGRWTREQYNRSCNMEPNGRYICLNLNTPCEDPWCDGPLGRLESNGWVYSAHCSFRIFSQEEAWRCLDGKWVLWWGDSSHLDTVRNMLNFVLGSESNNLVSHNFDRYFYRMTQLETQKPPEANVVKRLDGPESKNIKTVRMSSAYHGFDPHLKKYLGLGSVLNPQFQNLMDLYFNNASRSPDFVVLNSGMDDALTWTEDLEKYVNLGAETAAEFWKKALLKSKADPRVIFRHSVTAAGVARTQSINPQKLEIYNSLLVEALVRSDILNFHVVDNFDLSFPWHFDHECSDGPHYGRPPLRAPWVDRRIGHQYFVDLMLVHILLNAMCSQ